MNKLGNSIASIYSTRLEKLHSLFEHISRIFAYNRQRIERNRKQTWKNWNLGSHVFAKKNADERGQGHPKHDSFPACKNTRTPEDASPYNSSSSPFKKCISEVCFYSMQIAVGNNLRKKSRQISRFSMIFHDLNI